MVNPVEEIIDRKVFQSLNIHDGEYHHHDGRLILNFAKFSYVFLSVPIDIWEGLKSALSPGTYFHTNIRPRFKGIKMEREK